MIGLGPLIPNTFADNVRHSKIMALTTTLLFALLTVASFFVAVGGRNQEVPQLSEQQMLMQLFREQHVKNSPRMPTVLRDGKRHLSLIYGWTLTTVISDAPLIHMKQSRTKNWHNVRLLAKLAQFNTKIEKHINRETN